MQEARKVSKICFFFHKKYIGVCCQCTAHHYDSGSLFVGFSEHLATHYLPSINLVKSIISIFLLMQAYVNMALFENFTYAGIDATAEEA